MKDAYIGEIITVGFDFAPPGWLPCNGQTLPINEYEVLYALIGTTYGGDGMTTFGLPDFRGRVNVGAGQGTGLSPYSLGQQAGTETVTLTAPNLPPHSHPYVASVAASTGGTPSNDPTGRYPANSNTNIYATSATEAKAMAAPVSGIAQPSGNNQPHPNIQPVLALNCIICYEGSYPPRPN